MTELSNSAIARSEADAAIRPRQEGLRNNAVLCLFLSSATNVTIYTGVTKDLIRRVYEHKHNFDPNSFTARYSVHKLVYFEETTDVRSAIAREKQIKSWSRKKKNQLIETMNPMWEDLYDKLLP